MSRDDIIIDPYTLKTGIVGGYTHLTETVSSNLKYDGWAFTGTATSSTGWYISRTLTNGTLTTVSWANNGTQKNIWNNRTTYFTPSGAFTNTLSTQFDGVNDVCLSGGTINNFERLDPFSVAWWMKVTSLGSTFIIIGDTSSLTARGWSIQHAVAGADTLRAVLTGVNNTSQIKFDTLGGQNSLRINVWDFWTFTYTGSSTAAGCAMYRNAVQLFPITTTDTLTTTIVPVAQMSVGASVSNTLNFVGNLDEIAIYNKALSGAEITAIYNAGVPKDLTTLSTNTNLVNWYRMGDNDTFPVIQDVKGGAVNNLSMANMSPSSFVANVP